MAVAVPGAEDGRAGNTAWRRRRWWIIAAVALLGLVQLALPFTGDQAHFTVFGDRLVDGDVLYVDVWDVKQPLLFWWYAGAGLVAGTSEVGIHLVEVLYLVAFAALLPRLLRGQVSSDRAAAIAPALTIGLYFLVAEPIDLTQAEVLGGPLVFLAVWLGALAEPSDRRRLLLAGVAVGLATALKLTLFPVAAVGLLVPVIQGAGRPARRLTSVVVWSALGTLAVVALVVIHLQATDALDPALRAWFEVAPGSTSVSPPPLDRLVRTTARFLTMTAPVLVLAVAGATRLRRRPDQPRPRLLLAMVLWLVAAVPAFLIQHWWSYLAQIAVIPLGVLAAEGVEVVATWWRSAARPRRVAAGVVLCVTVIVSLGIAAPKWGALARHRLGITSEDRLALQTELVPSYEQADAFADGVTVEGSAFVLSDPLLLLRSGRAPGIPTTGWLSEQLDEDGWQTISEEIEQHRPPVIVVNEANRDIIEERAPEVQTLLEGGWVEVGGDGGDQWYVRRDLVEHGD